jgi:choline-sulfatase
MLDGRDVADRTVISEYTDMGVVAPCRMARRGPFKLMYTHGHPHRLYRLDRDPLELEDLAGTHEVADVESSLLATVLDRWDPAAVLAQVLDSQRRRLFLREVTRRSGRLPDWSYQAMRDDSRRYVRGHGAAGAKALARFPYVRPVNEPH